MKILLVTNLFPTPVDPERGVFTLQLAKKLAEKSEVTVVCPLPWFPGWKIFSSLEKWYPFSQVPYEYEFEGIRVISPKYPMIPKVSEAWHATLVSFGLKRCLKKLIRDENYDVVNSQWFYPDSVAVDKLLSSIDLPHVPTGLGCDVNHDLFDKDKRDSILKMLRNSAAVTVVSNDLKRVLTEESIPEKKVSVIPNGVDASQFKLLDRDDCRQQLDVPLAEEIILYVGRLSEEKNVASLIEAFAQLKSRENLKLYLVGDGPLKDQLEQTAVKLGISGQIVFVGKVEHHQVALWMGCCNYFSLPSYREGCPNVVLEALGSGRPVIASKVGAIPDVVSADSGVLFDPENIDDIANAFKKAFEIQWDGQSISHSVKSLSWENAAENYLNVFEAATK